MSAGYASQAAEEQASALQTRLALLSYSLPPERAAGVAVTWHTHPGFSGDSGGSPSAALIESPRCYEAEMGGGGGPKAAAQRSPRMGSSHNENGAAWAGPGESLVCMLQRCALYGGLQLPYIQLCKPSLLTALKPAL